MASGSLSDKLNLRSTSKIPLSDRFKMVRNIALVKQNINVSEPSTSGLRTQVSRKNRLLAQQMATKPSVMAALRLVKRSIKQRLGGNVTRGAAIGRRLTTRKPDASSRIRPKPSLSAKRLRLNRNNFVGTSQVSTRKKNQRIGRSNIAINSGNTNNTRPASNRLNNLRGRVRPGNNKRSNISVNSNNNNIISPKKSPNRPPLNQRGGAGSQRGPRGRGARGGPVRGNFRGGRGRGRNRGRGASSGPNTGHQEPNRFRRSKQRFQNRWQRRRANLDRDTLDKDLDSYMAKTKSQLDADLDAYMTGV